MNTVQPDSCSPGGGAPRIATADYAVHPAAAIDHVLDCVAGFHACETDARDVTHRLRSAHGLLPSQLMLLQPADAAWLPFMRRRRQWARGADAEGQSQFGDTWLTVPLGAMVAGLLCALWLLVNNRLGLGLGDGWEVLVFGVTLSVGALGGLLLSDRVGRSPQFRRFDDIIQHQLASGHWVVLAHDLPWQKQAGVVDLVRGQGLDWCAVAAARRWL